MERKISSKIILEGKTYKSAFEDLQVLKQEGMAGNLSFILSEDGRHIPAGFYDNFDSLMDCLDAVNNFEDADPTFANDLKRVIIDTTKGMDNTQRLLTLLYWERYYVTNPNNKDRLFDPEEVGDMVQGNFDMKL